MLFTFFYRNLPKAQTVCDYPLVIPCISCHFTNVRDSGSSPCAFVRQAHFSCWHSMNVQPGSCATCGRASLHLRHFAELLKCSAMRCQSVIVIRSLAWKS
jgi:hypothetical protein